MGQQLHKHTIGLEKVVAERTAEFVKLAYSDSLTDVTNRGALLHASNEGLNRSRRLSYDVGVMMLDVDHLKKSTIAMVIMLEVKTLKRL